MIGKCTDSLELLEGAEEQGRISWCYSDRDQGWFRTRTNAWSEGAGAATSE